MKLIEPDTTTHDSIPAKTGKNDGDRTSGDCISRQPEPAIPLSWIEGQIKWLKSMDNAFATLSAEQISAMVNKWKDEQDE